MTLTTERATPLRQWNPDWGGCSTARRPVVAMHRLCPSPRVFVNRLTHERQQESRTAANSCDLLVATAQPDSVSAANLRTAWTSGAAPVLSGECRANDRLSVFLGTGDLRDGYHEIEDLVEVKVAADLVCVLGGGEQQLAGCEHPAPALKTGSVVSVCSSSPRTNGRLVVTW